jgi:folate-dependent phosphoribosylglycinamide formyltransferase PurN
MLTSPPIRVAVLCSHRAPGLEHLLSCGPTAELPWRIVACVTSEPAFAEEPLLDVRGIPVIHHVLRAFRDEQHPVLPLRDVHLRETYDRRTVQLLTPYRPDVVLLAGYLLFLTRPMLRAYDGAIVNVHHADLALRDGRGGPRYPGLRAVRDAIAAGETETRCTAHQVTEALDCGPILQRSEPYRVPEVAHWARHTGAVDVLKKVCWAHQEWMLRSAFGPLMERTLRLLAARDESAVFTARMAS